MSTPEEQLENGATDWADRLGPALYLYSPSDQNFEAKWRGGQRDLEKRVGIFNFPGLDGSLARDLGSVGVRYPLTFYFDGPDNDLLTTNFLDTMARDRGPWTIDHPLYGFIELQPLSVTTQDAPVESGNVTEIASEWIEPLDEETLQTVRQLYGIVDALAADLKASAARSFVADTDLTTFGNTAATAQRAQRIADQSSQSLADLAAQDDDIAAEVAIALAGVADVVGASPLDTEALAGFLQAAIQKPALGTNDTEDRNTAYVALAASVESELPTGGAIGSQIPRQSNQATTSELAMSSIISSLATIATTGAPQTRKQAVEAAETLIQDFLNITAALDTVQQGFSAEAIDRQYFSQTETYSIAGRLITAAASYLLIASQDLRIEKRFTLKKPTTPLAVAVQEYGETNEGAAKDNIDLVIEANSLSGTEILLIPSGREIVVYV